MLIGHAVGVSTMPAVNALEVSGSTTPAPPCENTVADDVPPGKFCGIPAAAQLVRMLSLVLWPQLMQGSIEPCAMKLDRSPRYSSYSPGARNEVPLVARRRIDGMICQLRPTFQT